jgi:predicted O-methyltransferase YrrM
MNKSLSNNKTLEKLNFFVKDDLIKIKNLNILEFGVHAGISTKLFLQIIKNNKGKLISIDTVDYKSSFDDKNWLFLNCRDDNFKYINKFIKQKFDLIYLDTQHNEKHIKNIFNLYFDQLKVGGIFLVDDIFWLPYTKGSYRDNFHIEINNRESFSGIMDIYNSNLDKVELILSPKHTGMAKFIKLKNKKLNHFKKIINRQFSFKNYIRNLRNFFI